MFEAEPRAAACQALHCKTQATTVKCRGKTPTQKVSPLHPPCILPWDLGSGNQEALRPRLSTPFAYAKANSTLAQPRRLSP